MRTAVCIPLCLLGSCLAFGYPRTISLPDEERDTFRVLVSNDAFGPGPVAEWDDLRTFGMAMDAHVTGIFGIAFAYDALTWRSDSSTTASRIDSARAQLTLSLLDTQSGNLHFIGDAAIGASAYGDLGGMRLQEGLHGGIGVERLVPAEYDSVSLAALAATLSAEAILEGMAIRPAAFASLDTESPGPWRFQAGIRGDAGAPGSRVSVEAFYRYESGAGFSPTIDAVSRLMTGLVFAVECDVSYLTSALEMNASTGVSDGAFGIRIAPAGVDDANLSAMALEITANLGTVAPGRRVLFPISGPALRGYIGAIVGWWEAPGSAAAGQRFSQYSAGVEGRLLLSMGRLEWEFACAVGPALSIVTLQPLGEERSRIDDSSILLSARLEPAVRLGFVESLAGGKLRKTGLGVALVVQSPSFALRPFASGAGTATHLLSLLSAMLFVFSEVR